MAFEHGSNLGKILVNYLCILVNGAAATVTCHNTNYSGDFFLTRFQNTDAAILR